MITLAFLKTRILQVLEDPAGKRFDSSTLDESIRQALDLFNQRLPNIAVCTFTVATDGRDQPVTGLTGCLYLVSLCLNPDDTSRRELEPESGFTYLFQDGAPVLRFSGWKYPRAGDVIRLTYASRHTLQDLDGATSTTLPAGCESAVVNGAAAQACQARAALLSEAYGTRPEETARLLEMSRLLLDRFDQGLNQFKVMQQFGFPPGFALDADDTQTGRC